MSSSRRAFVSRVVRADRERMETNANPKLTGKHREVRGSGTSWIFMGFPDDRCLARLALDRSERFRAGRRNSSKVETS